jgi:predicted CXXCH cytochrome family protein
VKGPSLKISIAVVAAVVISIAVISCATVNRMVVAPPMIPGATYVGMETCAPCHEKEARDYKLAAHARVTIPNEKVPNQGCEACHGPGSLHVEAGGERGKFTINPSKSPEACYQCHLDKQAEFNLQYHHPVREGRMSCTTCHDPHGPNIKVARGMLISRVNDQCAQCHREQARVHVFEHDAMREGCTVCHNPHGSPFDKMLVERDSNLCLKCHAQVVAPAAAPGDITLGKVNHSLFLRSGTCISGGCHTAVHGSNINPHLRY